MPRGIWKIECDVGKHPPFIPQEHQTEVMNYFLQSKYKGLLLFHRLGSGKSCSSILISDKMLEIAAIKKVYVLTPGSLRQNYIEEYCEKCGYKAEYLKKYYTFITTNYTVGNDLPNFNDSLVIIDEVHNLMNGVKNQSKHPTLIYNALMKAKCRILALTGTPVFNYIWEWPFLGNLLKPNTFPNLLKDGELDTESFMKQFIIDDEGNVKPKNSKMFESQIRGIISYFPGVGGGFYPEVFQETPIQIPMTRVQNGEYWAIASWENDIRVKGPPKKSMLLKDPKTYYDQMEEFIMASKYVMSRMFSNFYYPKNIRSTEKLDAKDAVHHIGNVLMYLYKPTGEVHSSTKYFVDKLYNKRLQSLKIEGIKNMSIKDYKKKYGKDSYEAVLKKIMKECKDDVKKNIRKDWELKNIGWVNHAAIQNHQLTDLYSRKFVALLGNIILHWKSKHVVFSFFKTKSGVNMVHALFKLCGIRTEIYSGDISDSKRRKILKEFNAENNRYGEKIKALLVTEAGAEGINILEAQHMHILESSSREMKIQQAIGRVVRYKSHMVKGRKPMPKREQVVHIWRYWSVSDPEPYTIKREIKKSDGTIDSIERVIVDKTCVDEILYNKGRLYVNSMQSFLTLLKNSSVTSYDKDQDKNNMLKDYGILQVPKKMLDACKISDDRWEGTVSKKNIVIVEDEPISEIVKEMGNASDEEDEAKVDKIEE